MPAVPQYTKVNYIYTPVRIFVFVVKSAGCPLCLIDQPDFGTALPSLQWSVENVLIHRLFSSVPWTFIVMEAQIYWCRSSRTNNRNWVMSWWWEFGEPSSIFTMALYDYSNWIPETMTAVRNSTSLKRQTWNCQTYLQKWSVSNTA